MVSSKLSKPLVTGLLLVVFISISLYIRIVPLYDKVFWGDVIKFSEYDPWYYMRLVESLVHNFPSLITFDPYTFFPHGLEVFWHPFFTYLIAVISMIVGLGKPDEHVINIVAVYIPPILGALTVIPVYFIGKVLFNHWVGSIAAALIAIMPGEFLNRSILGFTDHHIAEVLLSTVAFLFLILAIKSGRERNLSWGHFTGSDRAIIVKPLFYSILGGIFLGFYVLTWVAALFFLFPLFIYFIIQFIIDHLRSLPTQYLGIVGVIFFLVAAIFSLPFIGGTQYQLLYILAFILSILTPVFLSWLSGFMFRCKLKSIGFPLTIIIVGIITLSILFVAQPSLFQYILRQFRVFAPSGANLMISEIQPLFFLQGQFSFSGALNNFSFDFFLSIISLAALIVVVIKRNSPEKTFLILWTLYVFVAMLAQSRFSYYFAINVAILTAYLAWLILERFGLSADSAVPLKTANPKIRETRRNEKRKNKLIPTVRASNVVLGSIVVVLLCFYPLTGPLPKINSGFVGGVPIANTISSAVFITDAWYNILNWLKNNTPDPFVDPDYYYKNYVPPVKGEDYRYPDSGYGIAALWDYGHMITRIAHRIPLSNPHQRGAGDVAKLFISQNEMLATAIMNTLNGRYLIIDTPTVVTKFRGVVAFAGRENGEFFDMYYKTENNRLRGDFYFYPEYYKSLAVRLYNFNNVKVTPQNTMVVTFQEKVFPDGEHYREITDSKLFLTYEQAADYIKTSKLANIRIVGSDPFVSPVPLEPLNNYVLIYSSDESSVRPQVGKIPEVKVFEYKK